MHKKVAVLGPRPVHEFAETPVGSEIKLVETAPFKSRNAENQLGRQSALPQLNAEKLALLPAREHKDHIPRLGRLSEVEEIEYFFRETCKKPHPAH